MSGHWRNDVVPHPTKTTLPIDDNRSPLNLVYEKMVRAFKCSTQVLPAKSRL
jgi:hypothetical protein